MESSVNLRSALLSVGQRVAVWVALAAVLVLVVVRLPFGVDFNEESNFLAMALRFAKGGKPFIDELMLYQTASILVAPLMALHRWFFGMEGLVLSSRLLYLGFMVIAAIIVYQMLRADWEPGLAACASLVVLAHVPLNTYALGYKTLGSGFLCLELFLLFPQNPALIYVLGYVMGGACLVLAVWCYPVFLIPGLIAAVITLKRSLVGWLSIVTGMALAAIPLFAALGPSASSNLSALIVQAHQWNSTMVLSTLRQLLWSDVSPLLWIIFLVVALLRFLPWYASYPILGLIPFAVLWNFHGSELPSLSAAIYLSLMAPFLLLMGSQDERTVRLVMRVGVPAIIAGCVAASTGNSASIGLWPALVVVSVLIGERGRLPQLSILVVLLLGLYVGRAVPTDGRLSELTAAIPSGPFKSLKTTPHKARWLAELTQDVRRFEKNNAAVVFYELPAGYLLTELPSASNTAWMRANSQNTGSNLQYFKQRTKSRSFIVAATTGDMSRPQSIIYPPNDPFLEWVRTTHKQLIVRQNHVILQKSF